MSKGIVGQLPGAGILLARGTRLTIPPGGLVVSATSAEIRDVQLHFAIWPHWLLNGRLNVDAAMRSNKDLLAATDSLHQSKHLESEFLASMGSICAQAFAIDALFDEVRGRLRSKPPQGKNRPNRARWIAEHLGRGFTMGPNSRKSLIDHLLLLYRLRDSAVHASSEPKPPVWREDIGAYVEWALQAFCGTNASNAQGSTEAIFGEMLLRGRDTEPEVRDWALSAHELYTDVLGDTSVTQDT